jgi:hypothetical protein
MLLSETIFARLAECHASDFLRQPLNLIRLLRCDARNIHACDAICLQALICPGGSFADFEPMISLEINVEGSALHDRH